MAGPGFWISAVGVSGSAQTPNPKPQLDPSKKTLTPKAARLPRLHRHVLFAL